MLTLCRCFVFSLPIAAIVLFATSCSDDAPTKPPDVKPATWEMVINLAGDDALFGVTSLSDGNYLALGYSNSNGALGEDYYVVKFTPDGDTLWTRLYGGSGGDIGMVVAGTSDGGAVLGGLSNSFGSNGLDIWILKIDSLGDTLWNHTFGGTGLDHINDLYVASDNSIIAVGMIVNGSEQRAWAAKFAEDGSILWDRQYFGTNDGELASIKEVSGGDFFLAAIRWGYTPFASWLTIHPNGDTVSSTWYIYQSGFYVQSMAEGTDGRFTLAGWYEPTSSQPRSDYFAMRIRSESQMQWVQKYGGAEDDECHAILPLPDGDLMLVGNTRSFDGLDWDLYVIKIDTMGAVVDQKVYKDDLETEMQDICPTPDGKYIIVGSQAPSAGMSTDAMIRKMEL